MNNQRQNLSQQKLKLDDQERELSSFRQRLDENKSEWNRTTELQQRKLNDQEKEIIILRQQLVESESKHNRSDENLLIQHSKITQLQTELEDLKVFKEIQLNQSLAISSQKAQIDHLTDELNGSKLCSPGVEAAKQQITKLEEQVNKTNGAYSIVLNDVVNKLNIYRNETERNLDNFTRGMSTIENQFHYVSLSTFGADKQLSDLNLSLSMWLHKLENEQIYLNSSSIVSMSDIRQQLHYLNTSLPAWLHKLEKELLGLNSSTGVSLEGIKYQIQHLNSTTLHSNLDIGNIQKRLEVMNSSMQGEFRQIAFTVSLTNPISHRYDNKKVVYDKVLANIGNAYSTQTGVFTCPQDGVYVFTWSVISVRESCQAFIYYNGARLLEAISTEESGSVNEVASNTAVISLSVGDHVWIQTATCYYYFGYPYTSFSGWKL